MDRYEIRVAGHVDHRRARALGCEVLSLFPGGASLLAFDAVDQAALYGLLARVRDAGLELIAAGRVAAPQEPVDLGARPGEPTREDPDVAGR
jgi:hypothetical protein